MKLLPTVILISTGLLAGCAGNTRDVSVSSQPPTAVPPPRAQVSADKLDPRVQKFKKPLNLTEQQAQQLSEIFQDTSAQAAALNKQTRELYKKKRGRINAVLTTEQAKKYEQILSDPPPEVKKAHPSPDE